MLQLTIKQMDLIAKSKERQFVNLVRTCLEQENIARFSEMDKEGKEVFVRQSIEECRGLNINIERFVYEFTLLRLKHGDDFYKTDSFEVDLAWLKSAYVPDKSKIDKVNAALNEQKSD